MAMALGTDYMDNSNMSVFVICAYFFCRRPTPFSVVYILNTTGHTRLSFDFQRIPIYTWTRAFSNGSHNVHDGKPPFALFLIPNGSHLAVVIKTDGYFAHITQLDNQDIIYQLQKLVYPCISLFFISDSLASEMEYSEVSSRCEIGISSRCLLSAKILHFGLMAKDFHHFHICW